MIEALRQTETKGAQALTLLWMSQKADDADTVRASAQTLATELNVHLNTAQDALRALIELGEIEVEERGRGRKPHKYRVLNKIGMPDEKPAEPINQDRQKIQEKPIVEDQIRNKPVPVTGSAGIRSAFRASVSAPHEFMRWCQMADRGAVCIYHIGMIAYDRTQSTPLAQIADSVHLLTETEFLSPGQHIVALPMGRQIAYTATRTGGGYAPAALIRGDVTAQEFTALRILRSRAADLSAARALRDGLATSEAVAANILRCLQARALIERGRNAGWVLTPKADRMVAV